MRVSLSPEMAHLTDEAAALSASRGGQFVGVEHLFDVLVTNFSLLPRGVRTQRLNALRQIQQIVAAARWRSNFRSADLHYTPRAAATLAEAGHIADRLRSGQANAGHLLLALLSDDAALPSRIMDRYNVPRAEIVEELQTELQGQSGMLSHPPQPVVRPDDDTEKTHVVKQPKREAAPAQASARNENDEEEVRIESFLRDLSHDGAEGKLGTAVGRDRETVELLQVLTRHGKNNVILVGEPGVGKTKIVESLAARCAQGDFEDMLKGKRILELNLAAMMSGTKYRGVLEEKLLKLIEKLEREKNTIVFIDEIHLIMGAGATEDSSMDIANILKPVLGRGEILCIGATTTDEFQQFLAKDAAIERRFHVIRVKPLSAKATLTVLEQLRDRLQKHHQIRISSDVLKSAIVLSEQYLPNRQLPDKAIDVVDQACARCRLKMVLARTDPKMLGDTVMPDNPTMVSRRDVQRVIEEMAGVKIVEDGGAGPMNLPKLREYLTKTVIGQDAAVDQVLSVLQRVEAGLSNPDKPKAVMFFLGPSGVGKSQLVKRLAKGYRPGSEAFTVFDMSEYTERESVSRLLGAPPGYAGSDRDGALVRAVRENPNAILLFDEIEKAHPSIYDILLPLMDEGRLKDSHDKLVRFNEAILIFTSNVGAEPIKDANSPVDEATLRDHLETVFRPEFINRVDELVAFYPLRKRDLAKILRMLIDEVRHRLKRKKIGVRMYKEAYLFLAEKGYSREYGARELRRTVERYVMTPIAEAVLNRKFVAGDMIDVQREGDKLVLSKGKPHAPKKIMSARSSLRLGA